MAGAVMRTMPAAGAGDPAGAVADPMTTVRSNRGVRVGFVFIDGGVRVLEIDFVCMSVSPFFALWVFRYPRKIHVHGSLTGIHTLPSRGLLRHFVYLVVVFVHTVWVRMGF